ncbi:erythromycin esterase family protein [Bacillus sp. FJAT-27245]|uniref:erythromycin esterase family protein n=1 Tax=Bacillus sp. FJAT-27245 TaxID=1684144 RepID=UPI0006A769A2|nr:erythromycin esterase family protein [Bacillus sp. FJAT-27245]
MGNELRKSITKWSRALGEQDVLNELAHQAARAKFVLLGEASHGTSEFYTFRAELSKKLISEHGFRFIAVEGDWPACQAINSYIKNDKDRRSPEEVLKVFHRWPTWMWANKEIAGLVGWMKEYNETIPDDQKAGFYGLDVYSLWESMDEIVNYLKKINSPDLEAAIEAFSCFEPFNRSNETYAMSAGYLSDGCRKEVVELLTSIRKSVRQDNLESDDALNLEINALVARNAEQYYRLMVMSDAGSWNTRDTHMAETLNAIMNFHGKNTKAIVWEHNTHIGDARATDMQRAGMINVGQIMREQHGTSDVFICGFGTHRGTVIAADQWGAPLKVMEVPPAQAFSWEDELFQAGDDDKLLFFTDKNRNEFSKEIGHRAIGVVYDPRFEKFGNYVPSSISHRYDAFLFISETTALSPLSMDSGF